MMCSWHGAQAAQRRERRLCDVQRRLPQPAAINPTDRPAAISRLQSEQFCRHKTQHALPCSVLWSQAVCRLLPAWTWHLHSHAFTPRPQGRQGSGLGGGMMAGAALGLWLGAQRETSSHANTPLSLPGRNKRNRLGLPQPPTCTQAGQEHGVGGQRGGTAQPSPAAPHSRAWLLVPRPGCTERQRRGPELQSCYFL